jgi:MoxR-like ATPase
MGRKDWNQTMDVKQILKAALFTPGTNGGWGLNLLFEGPPGVGKSGMIEEEATGLDLDVETIIASLREPSDFGGLPIPTKQGNRTFVEYAPALWAADLAEKGRGVVFIDEISTCPPAVQKALLRMVLNRALGDFILPPGTRFVAAQNAVADAAGGWDLAPPLANRFGHLPWEMPDATEWNEWLIGANGVDDHAGETEFSAEAEEARVLAAWPKAFAMAKGKIGAFIKSREELLFEMPPKGSAQRSKAWPSPRTWEMCTRALAGAAIHGLDEITTDEFAAAFVGHAAYGEFKTYAATLDLPDPERLLDGQVGFQHNPVRLDRTVAVLASCAAFVTSKKIAKKKPRASAMWALMGQIGEDAQDLIVPAAKALVGARGQGLLGVKEARPVLRDLQPILEAAGVRAA